MSAWSWSFCITVTKPRSQYLECRGLLENKLRLLIIPTLLYININWWSVRELELLSRGNEAGDNNNNLILVSTEYILYLVTIHYLHSWASCKFPRMYWHIICTTYSFTTQHAEKSPVDSRGIQGMNQSFETSMEVKTIPRCAQTLCFSGSPWG